MATLADAFADDGVELIFVDDGSEDGTADIVERACKEAALDAEVMRFTQNRGKGAAVRAGLLAAGGDTVGFVDADLSAGPAEIERVFAAVDAGRGDVVPASASPPTPASRSASRSYGAGADGSSTSACAPPGSPVWPTPNAG